MEVIRQKAGNGKLKWTQQYDEIVLKALSEVGGTVNLQEMSEITGLSVRTIRDKTCRLAKKNKWSLNPGITTCLIIKRMPDQVQKPKSRPSVYMKPSEPDIDRTTTPEQTRYAFKFRVSDGEGWSEVVHLFASGVEPEQALDRALSMINKKLEVELLNCTTAMELVSTREAMINLGASKRFTREKYGFNN